MQTIEITKIIKEWLDENNLDYNKNLSKFGHGHIMLQFTKNNDQLTNTDGQKVTSFDKLNTKAEIRDHLRTLIVKRLTYPHLDQARHAAITNIIDNNTHYVKLSHELKCVTEKEIDHILEKIFDDDRYLNQFRENQNTTDDPYIYELDTNYDEGYRNENTDRVIYRTGEHVYLAASCGDFYTEASTCLKGRSMSQAIKEDLVDELDEDEQNESLWEEVDLEPDPCWY